MKTFVIWFTAFSCLTVLYANHAGKSDPTKKRGSGTNTEAAPKAEFKAELIHPKDLTASDLLNNKFTGYLQTLVCTVTKTTGKIEKVEVFLNKAAYKAMGEDKVQTIVNGAVFKIDGKVVPSYSTVLYDAGGIRSIQSLNAKYRISMNYDTTKKDGSTHSFIFSFLEDPKTNAAGRMNCNK